MNVNVIFSLSLSAIVITRVDVNSALLTLHYYITCSQLNYTKKIQCYVLNGTGYFPFFALAFTLVIRVNPFIINQDSYWIYNTQKGGSWLCYPVCYVKSRNNNDYIINLVNPLPTLLVLSHFIIFYNIFNISSYRDNGFNGDEWTKMRADEEWFFI